MFSKELWSFGTGRLAVTVFAQFIIKDIIHRMTPGHVISIGKRCGLVYTLLHTSKL